MSDAPPRWHFSRWKLTGRVASFLYVSGITSCGGSVSWSGGGPAVYKLPRWRDVLPYRLRWDLKRMGLFKFGYHMRPYFLWKPDWWWQCHKAQGWRLWRHHNPEHPFMLGLCAACYPCPKCGAHQWCNCNF
ncbi:MAG TPA: hypothetical protein VMQ59_08655 [Acidimicrobiales bacterium]|jgi:hypothetical protein|nr:hypothetical protein [Acidimicrobiales bacterium]